MAEILFFPEIPSGYEYESVKITEDDDSNYYIVPNNIILKYFKTKSGIGTDLYVAKLYLENGDAVTLKQGYISSEPNSDILEKAYYLKDKIAKLNIAQDQSYGDSIDFLKKRPLAAYKLSTSGGYDILSIRCDRGIFSCAWWDNAKTDTVGLEMAAFVAYVYGLINNVKDETLWEIVNDYLPKNSSLDVEKANAAFREGLTENIVAAASAST